MVYPLKDQFAGEIETLNPSGNTLFDELRRPIFNAHLLPFRLCADRFSELVAMADESVVLRRVIPSDNSCLFNAVG